MENVDHQEEEDQHERSGSFTSFTWETNNCYDDHTGQTDLILAATLGKTLLEQNEELSSEYYKVIRKLETLTQDNFDLRTQLDLSEEASNQLIQELQEEVSVLREKLERCQNTATEQCLKDELERLNSELIEAGDQHDTTKHELKIVSDSLEREKSVTEEQSREIRTLKSDLSKVIENKENLEKFVEVLQSEKENLSCSLETAMTRVQRLEVKQVDHETIIRTNEREMEELKTSNHYLLEKLELWSMSHSSSPTLKNPSLMSELESSDGSGESSLQRSKTSFDIITEEDEDIEEYEYPELVKNDDEDDRDQWLEEVETVTNRIVSISNRVKDEYNLKLESFNHHQSNNCQKIPKLRSVTDELEFLVNLTFLDRNIDLLSKASQTDFSDHETQISEPCNYSKLAELETQTRNDEIIKKGLFEKLQILQKRLEIVEKEKHDLLTRTEQEVSKNTKEIKRKLFSASPARLIEASDVIVKEENNNSLIVSLVPQLEKIEDMIKHVLETKDPPKKLLRRS